MTREVTGLPLLVRLQTKPLYLGTVPPDEVAKRRARNKAARKARRANRSAR